MSPVETALIFAGIPLLVVAFIAFTVYGRSALHQPNRYRPGRPWNYPPAWYVPHPDAIDGAVPEHVALDAAPSEDSGVTPVGGASGEW
ncbi:MAG TPA: hypothetical protein VGH30_11535 [Jatrophihabitantaceae bacterium]|jgi:hypothetical protein